MTAASPDKPDVFSVVANLRREVFGPGAALGTKHFVAGAKLYCMPARWDGYEQIEVVGRHRGSSRLVSIVVDSTRLTNWRVQQVYRPALLARLVRSWPSREAALAIARAFARRDAARDAQQRVAAYLEAEPDGAALESAAAASLADWSSAALRDRPLGPLPFRVLCQWLAARGMDTLAERELAELLRRRSNQRAERRRLAARQPGAAG